MLRKKNLNKSTTFFFFFFIFRMIYIPSTARYLIHGLISTMTEQSEAQKFLAILFSLMG